LVEVQKLAKIAICNTAGVRFAKVAIIGTNARKQRRAESNERRD
jgi:hypothetical protein